MNSVCLVTIIYQIQYTNTHRCNINKIHIYLLHNLSTRKLATRQSLVLSRDRLHASKHCFEFFEPRRWKRDFFFVIPVFLEWRREMLLLSRHGQARVETRHGYILSRFFYSHLTRLIIMSLVETDFFRQSTQSPIILFSF